ncbi:MAG: hypothetical protein IPK68_21325 [Bdellovibrionales bacterium]|nr:hypothetical protein [Bdellovibrionales bacterium]
MRFMALFPYRFVHISSVFMCFLPSFWASSQPRISSQFFDRSKVGAIYIRPGLSSLIQFPCEIDEAKVGLKSSLDVQISKTLKSELVLSARTNLADPTNLIVRCSHGLFVFDVIANQKNHQDVIRILGGTKGPVFFETPLDQMDKNGERQDGSKIKNQFQAKDKGPTAAEIKRSPSLSEILKKTAKPIGQVSIPSEEKDQTLVPPSNTNWQSQSARKTPAPIKEGQP